MANFETRVEGLTGLSIDGSSSPTQDEVTQFLKDGVMDVTNRCISLNPGDAKKFQDVTAAQTSQGANLNGAKILSVVRESGIANQWEDCRYITPSKQYNVTDTSSLDYASKYHPVYTILEDGKISVYPTPGASPESYKVYYVNNAPQNASGGALAYNSSDLKAFPDDKVYLVILYTSIKSLQSNMGSATGSLASFSLSASAPTAIPDAPSIAGGAVGDTTIAALPSAPNYTAPVVAGATEELTATITDGTLGTDADFQDFSDWFEVLGHLIEDEEDSELATSQMQKIQTYIQAYNSALQNQLNIFNEGNAVYQAAIQRNIEQAKISMQDAIKTADLALQGAIQDYTMELQRVSTDAQKYQALVAAEVQTYQQTLAEKVKEYEWQAGRLKELKQEYEMAFERMKPSQQAGARN